MGNTKSSVIWREFSPFPIFLAIVGGQSLLDGDWRRQGWDWRSLLRWRKLNSSVVGSARAILKEWSFPAISVYCQKPHLAVAASLGDSIPHVPHSTTPPGSRGFVWLFLFPLWGLWKVMCVVQGNMDEFTFFKWTYLLFPLWGLNKQLCSQLSLHTWLGAGKRFLNSKLHFSAVGLLMVLWSFSQLKLPRFRWAMKRKLLNCALWGMLCQGLGAVSYQVPKPLEVAPGSDSVWILPV